MFRPFDQIKDTLIREVASATTQYVGYTNPGKSVATSAAKWKICKITSSGAEITNIQWASEMYDQVWDDRATLTYS